MSLSISVPGKTFLAGEYLALNEGPALLLATAPRYELRVRKGVGLTSGLHNESPAGSLIQKHPIFFNQFDLEFLDPHLGRGGWGASSAQYLACFALLQGRADNLDIQQLLKTYREVAWRQQGMPPSGADLIGQLKGQITYFNKKKLQAITHPWPFKDLGYFLIPTGQKIPTHVHLASLKSVATEKLHDAFQMVYQGFADGDRSRFVQGLQAYAEELSRQSWVHSSTLVLLEEFRHVPGVLAAKGCGALGADVILVIVEKDKATLFEALLKNDGRSYFTGDHLSKGLHWEMQAPMEIEQIGRAHV